MRQWRIRRKPKQEIVSRIFRDKTLRLERGIAYSLVSRYYVDTGEAKHSYTGDSSNI